MKKASLLNRIFCSKLSFYTLITFLALAVGCTALQSGVKIENLPPPITVTPTLVKSIQTQSFSDWCQRKASVPPATRHTIDVLLKIAKTNDCKSAEDRLKDYILRNGRILNLTNKKISDLQPISGLTQISAIFLSNNQINDLQPLTNLSELYNAQLDNNQISDLRPLAGMSKLSTLNLESNRIDDVTPLAALSASMRELILNNNQITDLSSLRVLRKLEQLHVRRNPLSTKECPVKRSHGDPVMDALAAVCRFD
jgi:internalin A